ncbi:MAG: hypothetical protein IJQ63_02250, partial [Synergistaceae bacterium]|nr:hypothetical protein [Synergistaceae bacterium]
MVIALAFNFTNAAEAAGTLKAVHQTLVDLTGDSPNGTYILRPEFSTARFFAVTLGVSGDSIPAAEATRTMTIKGGNYSFWDGKAMNTHNAGDAAETFDLVTGKNVY